METRGGFFGDLTSCPYCFSHWVGAFTAALALLVLWDVLTLKTVGLWFLLWTANVRCANVLSDVTHSFCRTPKESDVPEFTAEEEEKGAKE